jgi:hypothetical protein
MRLREDRKDIRRQVVEENLKLREGRTDEDQLALLDSRFGKNVGAKRERARLERRIEERNEKKISNKTKKRKKRNKNDKNSSK